MLMFRDMVGIGVILLLILVELFDDKNNPIWFILVNKLVLCNFLPSTHS